MRQIFDYFRKRKPKKCEPPICERCGRRGQQDAWGHWICTHGR